MKTVFKAASSPASWWAAAPAAWPRWLAVLLGLLALSMSVPPGRALIEQSMVWHMLVQMPLLVAAGACAALGWPQALGGSPRWVRWNRYGLTGFMLAQGITAYWMVPALVDRAVVLPSADVAKLASLWLAGVALRQGWLQAPLAVQLFFLGYGLPMLAWLGFYLASTDLRLCNAYSMESQLRTGWGLLAGALALGAAWCCSLWRQLRPQTSDTTPTTAPALPRHDVR